jgi:hypothetical protein
LRIRLISNEWIGVHFSKEAFGGSWVDILIKSFWVTGSMLKDVSQILVLVSEICGCLVPHEV